jgi:hypothetical protein
MSAGRSPWIIGALVLAAGGAAGRGAAALAGDAPAAGRVHGGDATTIVRASGDIRAAVNHYRALLGPDNGGAPGRHAAGRREIDWDAVPDALASPNPLPGGYFNARRAPRARGARLQTPGDHVAVSADSSNPAGAAVRFGDVNPTYAARFRTFSPQRLFSPIGSNIVNLRFSVPGTGQPAVVRGFGAVYTGVDRRENTAFRYFDAQGRSLGTFRVPVSRKGLSFLGVVFPSAVVARVRIEYGSGPLGPTDSATYDAAVMDDFIYGEPQPIG